MKKSKILAFALAAVLTLSIPGFAAIAATSPAGTLTGNSTVTEIVFSVALPTNLNFAVDPFEQGTSIGGGQITGVSYNFLNTTEAPVKIVLDFTANLATTNSPVLVDDPTTLAPDDSTVTTKELYLAVLGANTATCDDNEIETVSYDSTNDKTLVPFSADGKAKVAFALAASSDGTEVLVDGVSSFTFYGVLNTYAAWVANDVTVSAAYTLSGMRTSTYEEITDTAADQRFGVNQITVPVVDTTPVVRLGAVYDLSVTKANMKAGTGTSFKLQGIPTTVKIETIAGTAAAAWTPGALPNGHYEYNATTGVVTLHRNMDTAAVGIRTLHITTEKGVYAINLNLTA